MQALSLKLCDLLGESVLGSLSVGDYLFHGSVGIRMNLCHSHSPGLLSLLTILTLQALQKLKDAFVAFQRAHFLFRSFLSDLFLFTRGITGIDDLFL